MGLPDDAQQRVQDFQDAAAVAEAAALQFRHAAEALQAGHRLLSAAEHRLALDLLRPLLPAPPVPAVQVTRLARGVQPLRVVGDALMRLQCVVVMLGFMAGLAVVRLLPGHRPSSVWLPQVDRAHSQLQAPGFGDRLPTLPAAGLAMVTSPAPKMGPRH